MSEPSGSGAVWDEYRTLRASYYKWLGLMLAGMFTLFLFIAGSGLGRDGNISPVGVAVAGVMAALVMAAILRYSWQWLRLWMWPCPSCGAAFNFSLKRSFPGSKCVRCGLVVGSPIPGPHHYSPS